MISLNIVQTIEYKGSYWGEMYLECICISAACDIFKLSKLCLIFLTYELNWLKHGYPCKKVIDEPPYCRVPQIDIDVKEILKP